MGLAAPSGAALVEDAVQGMRLPVEEQQEALARRQHLKSLHSPGERLWWLEKARIDHVRHPHALALGLILPIRWRWDLTEDTDHIVLTGAKLMEAAGIRIQATNLTVRGCYIHDNQTRPPWAAGGT